MLLIVIIIVIKSFVAVSGVPPFYVKLITFIYRVLIAIVIENVTVSGRVIVFDKR